MSGVLAALGAALGFAVFQTVQRRALHRVDVYRATAAVLVVAATILSVASVLAGDVGALGTAPLGAVVACAAAGLLHFGLGWTLLGVSQVHLGAARTGVVVGTVPLFGALVAAVALDEPLGPVQLVGLALAVGGVVVVVGRRRVAAPAPAAAPAGRGSTSSASAPAIASGDLRAGVLAGLATAVCWSVSPVLIRVGLRDLPSPLLAAAVGMVSCAAAYVLGLAVTGRAGGGRLPPGVGRLLLVSGTAVGIAILLQWTSFDLTTIAVALAVLQLTPPLVVALSARVAGDALGPAARRRAAVGAALTLVGSLALVLAAA